MLVVPCGIPGTTLLSRLLWEYDLAFPAEFDSAAIIFRITEHVYATCDFIYPPSATVLWAPFTYSPYFVLIIGSMGLQLFVLGAGLARVAFVFTIEAVHSCASLASPFLLRTSTVYDLTITASQIVAPPKVRHL